MMSGIRIVINCWSVSIFLIIIENFCSKTSMIVRSKLYLTLKLLFIIIFNNMEFIRK